jgi:hypothetical protein
VTNRTRVGLCSTCYWHAREPAVLVDRHGLLLDAGAVTRDEEDAERAARIPLISAYVEAGMPVDYVAIARARARATA